MKYIEPKRFYTRLDAQKRTDRSALESLITAVGMWLIGRLVALEAFLRGFSPYGRGWR